MVKDEHVYSIRKTDTSSKHNVPVIYAEDDELVEAKSLLDTTWLSTS